MRKKRISDEIEKLLNAQIVNETINSSIYRAMANCLEYNGWDGAVKLYKKHSDEERGHAEKIIQYMQDRDCLPQIAGIPAPQKEYKGIKEIIIKTDELEQQTTAQWKKIASVAISPEEKDILTFEIAQWFLNEQIEEEAGSSYWVNRVEMFEATNKPLGDLDKEMEKA